MASIDDDPQATSDTIPETATRTADAGVRQGGPAIVPVNILVTPRDRKRLRQLSLDTGLSVQKLGHEAWNRLLESRGLEPLEPVTANVPSGRARRG
jgi:hypothetical protein